MPLGTNGTVARQLDQLLPAVDADIAQDDLVGMAKSDRVVAVLLQEHQTMGQAFTDWREHRVEDARMEYPDRADWSLPGLVR